MMETTAKPSNLRIETTTALALQVPGDPNRLEVYGPTIGRREDAPVGDALRPSLSEPLPGGLTAVALAPHGVAWADRAGRVTRRDVDLLELSPSRNDTATTSFWCGSHVHAMCWGARDGLLTGDSDGRLLRWDVSSDGQAPPELLASAASRWVNILPNDGGGVTAVAADGRWVTADSSGRVVSRGDLPPAGLGLEVRLALLCRCPGNTRTLLYTCGPAESGVPAGAAQPAAEPERAWSAWDLDQRQPVALPHVIRYADMLVADAGTVWAMNREGSSWAWLVGEAHPCELSGWPTGPGLTPLRIGDQPALVRLSTAGRIDAVALDSGGWTPAAHQFRGGVSRVWAGDVDTFHRQRRSRQAERIGELQRGALIAHANGEHAERDGLVSQLEELPVPGVDRRAHALRARFAQDGGDTLEALARCREVIRLTRDAVPPRWAELYGRLLWQTAAFDELCALGDRHRSLVTAAFPCATEVWQHLDRTLIDAVSAAHGLNGLWSTEAWDRVRRWGTAGPFWLGADHEPIVHLGGGDTQLLDSLLRICGADPLDIAILSSPTSIASPRSSPKTKLVNPSGIFSVRSPAATTAHLTSTGWVLTEPIAETLLHRQLVVWQLPGTGIQLASCWAVRGDRYAPPATWESAARAVQDPNWRAACRRRFEVALQAVACGVTPDVSMLAGPQH